MTAPHPTIRQRLFDLLIEPHQNEPTARNREYVFNIVVAGTGLCMAALMLLLLQSLLAGNQQVAGRLFVSFGGVLFAVALVFLSRQWHYMVSAFLLVGFYIILAGGSVVAWGIGTPFGVIMLAVVIVLAGTVLGARYALYAAALASVIVIGVQVADQAGWYSSTTAAAPTRGQLGDAIGQSVVFAILGTISWLFGHATEQSLQRAEVAEAALEREKASLKIRVAERTAALKKSQVE